MNIDELKYFVEAAREQNLSRAARTLGITQSTLSHAVRRLEGEFGLALFQKQGRAVRLTQHGKRFAQRAAELLQGIQSLRAEMQGTEAPVLGHYRVGATLGAPARIMMRAWSALPWADSATLELMSLRSGQILKGVGSRKLELGLLYSPQAYPGVNTSVIAFSDAVVMVRAGHPIVRMSRAERLKKLAHYPFATARHLPGVVPCSEHPIFSRIPHAVTARAYFDNYDLAVDLLEGSNAWAILPLTMARGKRSGLVPLFDSARERIELSLVWSESDTHSRLVEMLVPLLTAGALRGGWRRPVSPH